MRKQQASAAGVTWAEIASVLKREGIVVSRATVRKYQEMGHIPGPRPVGRTGKGRGVDWVWPEKQAQMVIDKIRQLRTENRRAKRLRRISQREAYEHMFWLHKEVGRQAALKGGIAWLQFLTPRGSDSLEDSLGARLIDCGLGHLDVPLKGRGTLLVLFAPDPEPGSSGGERPGDSTASGERPSE